MKKLLVITDVWPTQVTGVITVFDRIVTLLRAQNINVVVVHPGMFRRVYPFPLYPEQPVAILPGNRMRKIFEEEKPDAVHIVTEWPIGLAARMHCIRNNIPFTSSYHTNYPLYVAHYFQWAKILCRVAHWYMKWFHGAAEKLLVSTETLKQKLEGEGYTNVHVWRFGMDTDFFTRNEAGIPEAAQGIKHPLFLYVGRVSREKNTEEFLRASLPGSKVVVGDGPMRKKLERKYPDALFVGYQRGKDLVDWFSAADVCVFPSRTETFGMVMLEALSCGVPVAAHDVLGPRDVVTSGVDGFLDEDIAKAAVQCLAIPRAKCRETALTYSWERSANEFARLCEV